jgi:four helix bundle protein
LHPTSSKDARASEADYVHFLGIAYGSVRELEYQLSLSHRLGYLSAKEFARVDAQASQTCRVLNGLIRSMRR